MTRVIESDVCIIGGGISAAMVAERLAERTSASITVVEAGGRTASLEERTRTRARMLAYGANPYPNDHIPDQTGTGAMYRQMVVGGSAMHWGGAIPRYSPEDFRAGTFVLAAGHAWSPHLLLLSANSRFPDGLANRTGNVGRYMTGHWYMSGYIDLPMRLYPGIFANNSLLSHRFASPGPLDRYLRHDLRLWESDVGRTPRLVDDEGRLLWGDEVMADWRARTESGATARIRAYYDVIPDRESRLTLDRTTTNAMGDPMPRIDYRAAATTLDLEDHTRGTIRTSGCANGTLTFCALSLMAAEEIGREGLR